MISTRLRARWRALTTVLGLDLLRSEPHLRAQAPRAARTSAAAHHKHVPQRNDAPRASGEAR